MGVQALRHLGHAHIERPTVSVEVLQARRARIRRSAHDVNTAILIARVLLDRVGAEVRVDGGGVHPERREGRERIGAHGVAHVTALGVEQKRSARGLVAQLGERLPAVGAVLLPERAVRLEAARVLLGLAHDLATVAQRSRCSARDPFRVGVEADAQQRLPVVGERAQPIEVTHGQPKS